MSLDYKRLCTLSLVLSLGLSVIEGAVAASDIPVPRRNIPAFKKETACDWYQETRRTNTWFERDQVPRMKLMELYAKAKKDGVSVDSESLKSVWQEINLVDAELQGELDDLVARCGWPSETAFGIRAVEAAHFIVLHSPLDYQMDYIGVISEAERAGEFKTRHLAFLVDKMLVRQGKSQRYGTQLRGVNSLGDFEPFPIEDESRVDELRAAAGVIPASLCAYLSMMNAKLDRCVR